MAADSPRTLADQLRGWSDADLAHLLEARPDLATPAPQDSAQLASRTGTRASVLRAVDQLDVLQLVVVDATVALSDLGPSGARGGTVTLAQLQRHVNAAPEAIADAVGRLRALALLWGSDEALRALSVLAEVVGTSVSRLGPSAVELLATHGPDRVTSLAKDLGLVASGERRTDIEQVARHLADQANVQALVAEVDQQARRILEHLAEENAEGSVESTDRPVSRQDAVSPVDQLLTRGLLIARGRRHVAVAREVGLCLRGGRTTRTRMDEVPVLLTSAREESLVDRAAAGTAAAFVQRTELLLEHWGASPPSALRGGGLGVRELRAAAQLLQVSESEAALHVEVAAAAGLLAVGETDELDAAWLPTEAFDLWSAGTAVDRWVRLAQAWLDLPRLTGLIGGRDESRKPVNALAPGLERSWLPETRRMALAELAQLPRGQVLAAGTGVASLVDRLKWHRPRRPVERSRAVGWVLEEAAAIGVMALGGLARHGQALLAENGRHQAPAALEPLLPAPVDHVLLQADLTAVAPGPLERDLAHHLATMADIESRGGATVYRFTTASVRRAFDAGWSAAEIHAFVASSSRTPVPQPLTYLVDDVARRFGTLRVGAVSSFLRSDDEAALAELAHDPKATSLRLRRIAPTVVVSDAPVDVLLQRLRELGTAPVVEAPDGTVRLARKTSSRAPGPRRGGKPPEADAARRAARTAATVTAIRAGDRAAAIRPGRGAGTAPGSPAAVLAVLREAADAKESVWIGYVDNAGATVERVVDPVHVHAGRLTAYDHRADDVRLFAVHRISSVRPVRHAPDR